MRQSRAQLRNTIADLEERLAAAHAQPAVAAHALADNVRLAHRAERAELLQHRAEGERDALMSRLVVIAARHPQVFAGDELTS